MSLRSLSFGAVAADYEKYRPGYPDELVRAVLDSAYLQRPEPVRREALDEILGVLPDEVEMVGDITLHLARRR